MGIEYGGEILMTTAEAAHYLEVGRTSVARYCEKGYLRRRKIPGDHRNFVTLDSLLRFRKSKNTMLREVSIKLERIEQRLDELARFVGFTDRPIRDDKIDEILSRHHPGIK